jgi:hypothetical protein
MSGKLITTERVANITARDIERGKQGSCALCPLARAASRLFPGMLVQAYYGAVCVFQGDGGFLARSFWSHQVADSFLRPFDEGMPVKPMKVKLTLEDW